MSNSPFTFPLIYSKHQGILPSQTIHGSKVIKNSLKYLGKKSQEFSESSLQGGNHMLGGHNERI